MKFKVRWIGVHFLRTGIAPDESRDVENLCLAPFGWKKMNITGDVWKMRFQEVSNMVRKWSKKCSREAHATAQPQRFSEFWTFSTCERSEKVQKQKSHPHARWGCDFWILVVLESSDFDNFGLTGRMKIVFFKKQYFLEYAKKTCSLALKRTLVLLLKTVFF